MIYILPVIASYIIGSTTFSFIVGKWLRGIDVREHGSGNAGATNTLRTIGKGPAILVLALDLFKGVLAVWIGMWAAPDHIWVWGLCGIAVVIGHNWPVFFHFKGGKGVATTIGVALSLCFIATIISLIVVVIVIAISRYVSLGSLVFAILTPNLIWLIYDPFAWELLISFIILATFLIARHRHNIIRLIKGQENKLGAKS